MCAFSQQPCEVGQPKESGRQGLPAPVSSRAHCQRASVPQHQAGRQAGGERQGNVRVRRGSPALAQARTCLGEGAGLGDAGGGAGGSAAGGARARLPRREFLAAAAPAGWRGCPVLPGPRRPPPPPRPLALLPPRCPSDHPSPPPEGSCSCNLPECHGQTAAGREPHRADRCCAREPRLPSGGDGGRAAPRLPEPARPAARAELLPVPRRTAPSRAPPLHAGPAAAPQPHRRGTRQPGGPGKQREAGAPHRAAPAAGSTAQRVPPQEHSAQPGAGAGGPPSPHGRPVPSRASTRTSAAAAAAEAACLGAPVPLHLPAAGHLLQLASGTGGGPWTQLAPELSSCWPGGRSA